MTSKIFKSALDSPVTLEVERETHPAGVYLTIGQATILLGASDAPALALALLEAAGWPNEHLATTEILRRLRELDEHVKAVEAEARELAELEAEALELCNAHRKACGSPTATTWNDLTLGAKENWLAVTRRAREIAKEAAK